MGRALSIKGKETMSKHKKPLPIIVTLEGGLVTCVSLADRRLIERPVMVIDYDTDGAEVKDLDRIRWHKTSFGSAGNAMAYVHGDEVVRTCLTARTQKTLMEAYA
jgi:hypothetical protein